MTDPPTSRLDYTARALRLHEQELVDQAYTASMERVRKEHEAKEAELDAKRRKEFEAALALKRRFAPIFPFCQAFEDGVNKVRPSSRVGSVGSVDAMPCRAVEGGQALCMYVPNASQLTHSTTFPPSHLTYQVRRAEFEAHVGRMRQDYERAMKMKIQRWVRA